MKPSLRFDLIDLRLFLRIADAGSITAGAAQAGLALASASERIRAMEQSFGAALLDRQHRGVRPTAAGTSLLHHARIVARQLELMRGELIEHASGLRGRVRLLSNTAAAAEFLPKPLAAFLAAHPAVDIELEEKPSGEIVRAIAGGKAEIGIVADAVDAAAELETFPFAEDRLVLVTPRGHALGKRRSVAFKETLDCDHIGLSPDAALQAHLADRAQRAGRRLKLRLGLPGFDAICRTVENGDAVAVVPATAAARAQRSLAIRIVPLSDAWARRRLMLCIKDRRALSAPARDLVAALRASAANFRITSPGAATRAKPAASSPMPRRSSSR